MRKIFFVLALLITAFTVNAQVFTKPNNGYGTWLNRGRYDSTLYFATTCGTPTNATWLFSQGFNGNGEKPKLAALLYDSCGHTLYVWDPSTQTWASLGSGSTGTLTDSLSSTYIPYWDISGTPRFKNSPLSTTEGVVAIHGNNVLYFGGVGAHGSSYASWADTSGTQVFNIGEYTAIRGAGTPDDMLFFQGTTTGKTIFDHGGDPDFTILNGAVQPFVGTSVTRPSSPEQGYMYYDIDSACIVIYKTGLGWRSICGAGGGGKDFGKTDTLAAENRSFNANQFDFIIGNSKTFTIESKSVSGDTSVYVSANAATAQAIITAADLTQSSRTYHRPESIQLISPFIGLNSAVINVSAIPIGVKAVNLALDASDNLIKDTSSSSGGGSDSTKVDKSTTLTIGPLTQSLDSSRAFLTNVQDALQVINKGDAPSVQVGLYSARPVTETNGALYIVSDSFYRTSIYDAVAGSWLWIAQGTFKDTLYAARPLYVQPHGVSDKDSLKIVVDTPIYNANKIQSVNVAATTPTNGQTLAYNTANSRYEPVTPSSGTNYLPGLNAQILTDQGSTYIHSKVNLTTDSIFYILGDGQSNMGDQLSVYLPADTVGDDKIQIWNNPGSAWVRATVGQAPFPAIVGSTVGLPTVFYLAKLIRAATGKKVRIIRYYHNSTAISGWFNGVTRGPDMASLLLYANNSSAPRIDLYVRDQGENDNGTNIDTYTTACDSIKATLRRQTWFPQKTPMVFIGMPLVSKGSTTDYSYADRTLRNFDGNQDPYDLYANTDSAEVKASDIHFTNAGKKVIASTVLEVYNRMIEYPKTRRLDIGYIDVTHRDSLPYASATPYTVRIKNTSVNGASGIQWNSENGTAQLEIVSQNGSTSVSSLYTAGQNIIASRNSKNLEIWTANAKRAVFSTSGLAITGAVSQTQTGTGLFNSYTWTGQDAAHSWQMGPVGSTYSNPPIAQNSFSLYNNSTGIIWNLTSTGLMGLGPRAQSGVSRFSVDGTLTVSAPGKTGSMFNIVRGVITDNTTPANTRVNFWAVNNWGSDTLYFNNNNDTTTNGASQYFPGPPRAQTAHTYIEKPWNIYADTGLNVLRGGLLVNDTVVRGSLMQINSSIWQEKDSVAISSAGSVMSLGLDTITKKYVRFTPSSAPVSGHYLPTSSSNTNAATVTLDSASYTITDNTVTGRFSGTVSATAGGTNTLFHITAPVTNSNWSVGSYCGSGSCYDLVTGISVPISLYFSSATELNTNFLPATTNTYNYVIVYQFDKR